MLSNKKNTIMLIDSDPALIKKLSGRLSNSGFSVISAMDTNTAYKTFLTAKPDIVLLDIQMKFSNGAGLFEKIKPLASSDNIPVIILVPDLDMNTDADELLSEANDYIIKPFRFAEALTRINNQFKVLKIQRELEQKNKELMESNAFLQQQTITDTLTGLYNKRYILDRLHSDIAHSIRYKEPISFIMADIDYFKRVNDKFGHQAGDKILKATASIIKDSVRKVDITARYGGEEFLVVCPNTGRHGAARIAERIRKRISAHRFKYKDNEIHITISFGLKCAVPDIPISIEETVNRLIEDADRALYNAKKNGRNRIEIFNNRIPTTCR